MEILIVEDDIYIANAEQEILNLKNYDTKVCYSGTEAVELIKEHDYDLILLDVMLPGLDGFQVMERVAYRNIPIIFVTARQDIKDRLHGFNLGAVDYIIKPFEMMELLARVEVALRRNGKTVESYQYGDVSMDIAAHTLRRNGKTIGLTPKEFELASYFIRNQNIILDREKIICAVWGADYMGETRTIDNHIRQLRKKIGWQDCLVTVPRLGYKLMKIN